MYIIPNIPEYSDFFWQGLLDDLAQLSHVNTFTSFPPTCMLFAVERFFSTFRFERYNVLNWVFVVLYSYHIPNVYNVLSVSRIHDN